MNIVSWNIQAGKGVDSVTDIDRIARVTLEMGDSDIVCFQEVIQQVGNNASENMHPDRNDQVKQLAHRFPEYQAIFGPAVDRWTPHGRLRFGNLVLSRLPIKLATLHKLPQPCDPKTKNMPRQAVEVVVEKDNRCYRVVTTHLEFFSTLQRRAQVEYLCQLHKETLGRAAAPSMDGGDGVYAVGPETELTIFCGDFNLTVDTRDYQQLTTMIGDNQLVDAWRVASPDVKHAPTCGIFDHEQWPDKAHCRDYFFVSKGLANAITAVDVNTDTNASDHQPLKLTLQH